MKNMKNKKKITQIDKIKALHNLVKEAKILIFVAGMRINRYDIKTDRSIFKKKWFHLYKTNVYRGKEVFYNIPLFKRFASTIGAYFFVVYSRNKKRWKKLVDAFKLPLRFINPLFVIQNKTFLGPVRLSQVLLLKTKAYIAAPINNSPVFLLIKGLLRFLTLTFTIEHVLHNQTESYV